MSTEKISGIATSDRTNRQPNGQMGFANAGRAQKYDIFGTFHKGECFQFVDLTLVGTGLEIKVKGIDGLDIGKFCKFQVRRGCPFSFCINFCPKQLVQKLQIGYTILGSFFRMVVINGSHMGEIQTIKSFLQVMGYHVTTSLTKES